MILSAMLNIVGLVHHVFHGVCGWKALVLELVWVVQELAVILQVV